jgi:hypothetical protein
MLTIFSGTSLAMAQQKGKTPAWKKYTPYGWGYQAGEKAAKALNNRGKSKSTMDKVIDYSEVNAKKQTGGYVNMREGQAGNRYPK